MAKKALCVGINYRGTEYELRGCINDADDWSRLLGSNGFDVSVLAEKQATKANIVMGIRQMIKNLQPGDVGCITYSGHGTWVPDIDGDEPDKKDEAICPVDMGDDGHNLIIDDEFHAMFNLIPKGAHVVFASDSCHSGSVFRFAAHGVAATYRRPRFIPPIHFSKSVDMIRKVERAFGQPITRSNAPLPGLVFFSGCKDAELSNDAEIGGHACGAFSYYATKAFGRGVALGQTYAEVHAAIRKNLPSWDFQQTPLLAAEKDLKNTKVLE